MKRFRGIYNISNGMSGEEFGGKVRGEMVRKKKDLMLMERKEEEEKEKDAIINSIAKSSNQCGECPKKNFVGFWCCL